MLDYDLHCHSNYSDGTLSPTELVERAAGREVKVLALTDHDDVAGLEEGAQAAAACGIQFINGVEISVSWRKYTVHTETFVAVVRNLCMGPGLGPPNPKSSRSAMSYTASINWIATPRRWPVGTK